MQFIENSQLKKFQSGRKPFVLVDIREHEDYKQSHIPGAISMPARLLKGQMTDFSRWTRQNKDIILYCTNISEAIKAAELLTLAGKCKNIKVLRHGYAGWLLENN